MQLWPLGKLNSKAHYNGRAMYRADKTAQRFDHNCFGSALVPHWLATGWFCNSRLHSHTVGAPCTSGYIRLFGTPG